MHSSRLAVGNLYSAHQHCKAPYSPEPVLPFWILHIFRMSLLTGGKWHFLLVWICIVCLLSWPKSPYAFSPEYIQEKTHTPVLVKCIIVDVVMLFLCFKSDSNVPLEICFVQFCLIFKSASWPSLNRFLEESCPLQLGRLVYCCSPELHFSTLVFVSGPQIHNFASGPIQVPGGGQAETLVNSSPWQEIRVTCARSNAYSYSLIGSHSSLSSSAQFANCANQEVRGADSPSCEIDSKAVGMSNRSTRRGTLGAL